VHHSAERRLQFSLALVQWRPAGAVAVEQFWMVRCLLGGQRPTGVAPAVTHLHLLASLLRDVLLMRSCYYLLAQITLLLMVAMLVLLCSAVLLLAQQWPKQSDAMSRFLSPAFPIDAAGAQA
jgi:hypothetical protein